MRSNRLFLLFGSVALVSSCLGGGGFKPSSPDPVVWIDSERHDWGTVAGSETVEHVFQVRNTGGAPLNITRVQTSCGCTAAVLDHQYLKPGEETRLKVTFDPRGRHGSQTRTVWIHSNDPKTPQKQIVIQANIGEPPAGLPSPVIQSSTTSAATSPMPSVTTSPAAPAQPAPTAAPAPATAPAAAEKPAAGH